jgi:phosphonate transport system permease protein
MSTAKVLSPADAARADLAGFKARHPAVFRPSPLRRAVTTGTIVLLAALLALAFWRLDVSLARIWAGLGQLGTFLTFMLPPSPGSWSRALVYLHALAETVAIAFLGTLLAAILSFPLGFLAARNATVNRVVQLATRRFSDAIRGVDQLIWALIWVSVVGLGPFAGVPAVMTSDIGNFTKLFSEAVEATDRKAEEGVMSTGGGRLHRIRFGLLPQVFPVIAGQVLYFFESNTRSATIIGIVGAGGIGLHLSEQIRTLEWQAVSFIIILILVAVAVIDFISTRLRLAIIGRSTVQV